MSGYTPPSPEIHAAVHGLLSEFSWRVDSALGDTVAALFTDDAVLETPHFKLEGKDAIHTWFSERAIKGDRISRHHSTNVRITPVDADTVHITANALTLVAPASSGGKGAAAVLGTSSDILVRTSDVWRFRSRSLNVVIEGRLPAPEAAA